MTWSFRSGWCGLDSAPWQHGRCAGGYGDTPCVCSCHSGEQPTTADQVLVELVERHDLAGLVDELEALTRRPGLWPPALQKVRTAALELLNEVTPS